MASSRGPSPTSRRTVSTGSATPAGRRSADLAVVHGRDTGVVVAGDGGDGEVAASPATRPVLRGAPTPTVPDAHAKEPRNRREAGIPHPGSGSRFSATYGPFQ
jgi:hypothetical protein